MIEGKGERDQRSHGGGRGQRDVRGDRAPAGTGPLVRGADEGDGPPQPAPRLPRPAARLPWHAGRPVRPARHAPHAFPVHLPIVARRRRHAIRRLV